jgi:hypothetical protein
MQATLRACTRNLVVNKEQQCSSRSFSTRLPKYVDRFTYLLYQLDYNNIRIAFSRKLHSGIEINDQLLLFCRHAAMPLKISHSSTSHHLGNSSLRRTHLCHGTIDPEALTDRNTPISELQKLLQTAIDSEDYAVAAQLRDEIEYVFIYFLSFFLYF